MVTNNAGNIPTGASGTVLQGQGVGTAPAFSTATYPSTAGANGNLLTSNGTNWVSAVAPGLINVVTPTLTNSQIKNLNTTPVQVIAAQGSGTVILIVSCSAVMQYGGNNIFTAGASQTINLYYGTTTNILTALNNLNIVAANSTINWSTSASLNGTETNYDDQAVNLWNPISTNISGNAADDNTMAFVISYIVVNI
jgi:hypothetical protein